jgi:HSP20 family molecular chaperone IbpA
MANVEPAKKNEQTPPRSRESESTYVPDVDIRESAENITLAADMPGTDRSSVEVTAENNVLTIEGQAHVEAPEGYELIGQEYGVGRFRRTFTLSSELSVEGIRARVDHGVLEVTIPRREDAKPRKIEIAS